MLIKLKGHTQHLYYIPLHFRHLPHQFPQEKPIIRISPPVQHPWVNADNVITGCADINNVCGIFLI